MAGEAGAVLRALGVTHSRFVMWQPGRDHLDNLMLVDPGKLRAPLALPTVVSGVVAPLSCGLWSGAEPPPYSWFYTEALVESYVVTQLTGRTAEPYGRLLTSKGAEESRGAGDAGGDGAPGVRPGEGATIVQQPVGAA